LQRNHQRSRLSGRQVRGGLFLQGFIEAFPLTSNGEEKQACVVNKEEIDARGRGVVAGKEVETFHSGGREAPANIF